MSHYQLEPSPPSRDPTRSLIVGIILVLLFLAVIASLFLLSRTELVLASTPTPTATFAFVATATPDFGATRVAEDLAAQHGGPAPIIVGETRAVTDANANEIAMAQSDTPPAVIQETVVATVTATETVTAAPTTETVQDQPGSPSPVAAPSDTPSPVAKSSLVSPLDTPSATPTAVPAATATATPTLPAPTDTATPVPVTPSPTIPPTPLPTPYMIDHLLAVVEYAEINRQLAPISGFDTESDQTWKIENEIRLLGRSTSGEWVYGEQDGEFGWLRQVLF